MDEQTKHQVNCICEHAWHKHLYNKSINAPTLLEAVRDRMPYNPKIRQLVDDWIGLFMERTGYYPLISSSGKQKAAGGRNSEAEGNITYLG